MPEYIKFQHFQDKYVKYLFKWMKLCNEMLTSSHLILFLNEINVNMRSKFECIGIFYNIFSN